VHNQRMTQQVTTPRSRRGAVTTATALALLAVCSVCLAAVFVVLDRHSNLTPNGDPINGLDNWLALAEVPAYSVVGWGLASRRPEVLFGWLALATALSIGYGLTAQSWVVWVVDGGGHVPGMSWFAWVAVWTSLQPLATVVTWALFPSGGLPRGRIRWLALLSIGLCSTATVAALLGPISDPSASEPFRSLRNPLGFELFRHFPFGLFVATGLLLGSVLVVVRWRSATGTERQVLRWLGVVNIVSIVTFPVVVVFSWGEIIADVGTVVSLLVIAAAVLANNVYGLDAVLNRTLVYVLLTGVVAAAYSIGVGIIAALGLAAGGGWRIVAAVAAGFCLAPARQRVTRLVNRFLYGDRDDPYAVLTAVGTSLELAGDAEELLPRLAGGIVDALRLPYVAIELAGNGGGAVRIEHGATSSIEASSVRFPLVHQGTAVGALVVGLRSGQSTLQDREAELIDGIARQVAVAVANVGLTGELLRSRERIIVAGEEERRRLRRDLHDGLGPVLTAAANKVDAARNVQEHDPSRADALLVTVRADLATAIGDLRRLVYALRPPALDELGLVGALGEHVHGLAVPVVISVADALPVLPPAVEIAAYRIVTEAMANVGRHSAASQCVVSIEHGARLVLDIRDDGTASAPWKPGVGLTSMRERTAALGGTWSAGPSPSGGYVHVELPLTLSAAVSS
jgi:two-component system, NarL family, sensor kinase